MDRLRRGIAGKWPRAVIALIFAVIALLAISYRPPAGPEHLYALANQYVQDFRYEDALKTAEDALTMVRNGLYDDTYVAKFYLLRGQMWLLVYEWDAALSDYDRAVELAPDYPEAYYLRGLFFYTRMERELALADFETVVALDPDGRFTEQARVNADSIRRELEALTKQ